MKEIELGDKVRDTVSGLIGIAVSEIKYLNGCLQYGVQAPFQDGKLPNAEYIDVGQLVVVTKRADVQTEEEGPGGNQRHAPK
ncbi:hypothetical protein ES703_98090 [subsurface metagenome]|nr:hypothetical protein [bacterium]